MRVMSLSDYFFVKGVGERARVLEAARHVPSNAHDVAGLIAQDRATSDVFDRMTRLHGYDRATLIWSNGCDLYDSWHAEDAE